MYKGNNQYAQTIKEHDATAYAVRLGKENYEITFYLEDFIQYDHILATDIETYSKMIDGPKNYWSPPLPEKVVLYVDKKLIEQDEVVNAFKETYNFTKATYFFDRPRDHMYLIEF